MKEFSKFNFNVQQGVIILITFKRVNIQIEILQQIWVKWKLKRLDSKNIDDISASV